MEKKRIVTLTNNLPTDLGTYTLILKTKGKKGLQVGKLGLLTVQPGYYVYIGSAFGPGGLRGRLSHHLRRSLKPRWHIDYLRRIAKIAEIWFLAGTNRYEHQWAEKFQLHPETKVPFPRFGASDCKCRAHLFFYETKPDISMLFSPDDIKKQVSIVIIS